MDNQLQIETNGTTKYLKDDHLNSVTSVYGTRKSSRRLNQINLNNSDHNFNNLSDTHHHSTNQHPITTPKDSSVHHLSESTATSFSSSTSKTNSTTVNNQLATNNQTNQQQQISATTVGQQSTAVINTPKQQRKWEQWQQDDTRWFFEALNENGKDFNAIHSYMTNRLKKKGVSEELIKNKEQIRCYFNRQWNKICTIFDNNNDEQSIANLDKTTKQLYALINYGEIWKKQNFKNDLKIDAKLKSHLNELVFKGYTFLKIGKKGKNIKLKTPLCKALKKIYYFENIYKSVNQNLPKDIVIELVPATNYAWMKVHCLSQNPRARIKCSLQKRFSTLIKYLEDRWNEQKYYNFQIESLTNECLIKSPKNDEKSNLIESQINESNNQIAKSSSIKKIFKVKPHPNHHKNLTGLKFTRIQPVPFNSQMDISLSAYILKINSKQPNEQQKVKRNKNPNVNCSKKSISKDDDKMMTTAEEQQQSKSFEPLNSHSERSNTSHVLETVRELNLLNNIISSNYLDENNVDKAKEIENDVQQEINNQVNHFQEEKSLHLADPPPNATIAEWLSANKTTSKLTETDKNEQLNDKKDKSPYKDDQMKKIESHQDQQESIYNRMKKLIDPSNVKNGWSADEIEDLTIGELYLMLRKPVKIVLQYDWSIVDLNKDTKETSNKNSQLNTSNCSTGHTTNYSSLVSKLITAITIEMMTLNKERNGSVDFESDCLLAKNNGAKIRKNKKLKTTHCADDHHQIIESANHGMTHFTANQIIENNNNELPIISSTVINSSNDELDQSNKATNSNYQPIAAASIDKFAVPCSPVPKSTNKNRIVNEQLLQEAKDQLNNIKFNSTRRNFNIRKPNLMKQQHPQQFQLNLNNLNTNQLLGSNLTNNICQLIANQSGTLATVPVNVSSSPNGQTALISVITQVNQNGSSTIQPVQIIDGSTIQINNATTLNDLCTFVQTNCTNKNGEITNHEKNQANHHLNGAQENGSQTLQASNVIPSTIVQTLPSSSDTLSSTDSSSVSSKKQTNGYHHNLIDQLTEKKIDRQGFITNSSQANPVNNNIEKNLEESLQLSMNNLPVINLSMNSILSPDDDKGNDKMSTSFNESCLKVLNDDKSVSFGNLLDISLSDTIFNDSSPFPSDVSIDSSFSTKNHDQTLNTPIKLSSQKTSISHTNAFTSQTSQFNLFDTNLNSNLIANQMLNSNNRNTDSNNSFTDSWINMNNLTSDISLNNIFADCSADCTNFDGVLNANRLESNSSIDK